MRHLVQFALALFCLLGLQFPAQADPSSLTVENPNVRVTIPGRPAAGYLTISNKGAKADALVSAASPLAKRIELHTHLMDGGIVRMRPVEQVEIPANGKAEFSPGGDHLMIFDLDNKIEPGDALPLTLKFKSGRSVEVDFAVSKVGNPDKPYAKDGKDAGHQHHHKH